MISQRSTRGTFPPTFLVILSYLFCLCCYHYLNANCHVDVPRQKGGPYTSQSILVLSRFSANKGTLFEINQLYITWPKMYQKNLSSETIFLLWVFPEMKIRDSCQRQSRYPNMIDKACCSHLINLQYKRHPLKKPRLKIFFYQVPILLFLRTLIRKKITQFLVTFNTLHMQKFVDSVNFWLLFSPFSIDRHLNFS